MKSKVLFLFLTISLLLADGISFAQTTVAFETGKMCVQLNKLYGRLRLYTPNIDGVRHIDRTTILVSSAPDKVFDYKNDYDVLDTPMIVTPPTYGDFEIAGSFDNTYSDLPPDVVVYMNIYGWTNKSFILYKMKIHNRESAAMNSFMAMETIYNTAGIQGGGDTVEYIAASKIVHAYNGSVDTVPGHIGMKILGADPFAHTSMEYIANYWEGDTMMYRMIATPGLQNNFISPALGEPTLTFFGKNSVPIAAGDTSVMYVAIAVAASKAEMLTAMAEAEAKYNALFTSVNDDLQPTAYRLHQNYPNPFNPSTRISFDLPVRSDIKLSVFDMLGQEVATLANGSFEAGSHTVQFDASNLTSGMYLYRLSAGSFTATGKMSLVR